MKRRLVAVTLSLIMTMATVSEAGAAAFTSPDTAPAVATQTDAEEENQSLYYFHCFRFCCVALCIDGTDF